MKSTLDTSIGDSDSTPIVIPDSTADDSILSGNVYRKQAPDTVPRQTSNRPKIDTTFSVNKTSPKTEVKHLLDSNESFYPSFFEIRNPTSRWL